MEQRPPWLFFQRATLANRFCARLNMSSRFCFGSWKISPTFSLYCWNILSRLSKGSECWMNNLSRTCKEGDPHCLALCNDRCIFSRDPVSSWRWIQPGVVPDAVSWRQRIGRHLRFDKTMGPAIMKLAQWVIFADLDEETSPDSDPWFKSINAHLREGGRELEWDGSYIPSDTGQMPSRLRHKTVESSSF